MMSDDYNSKIENNSALFCGTAPRILELKFEPGDEEPTAHEILQTLKNQQKNYQTALREAERAAQREKEEGFRAGYQAGEAEALLHGLVNSQFQDMFLTRLSHEIEAIFLSLLQQIDESLNSSNLRTRIHEALGNMSSADPVRIFVSGDDFPHVEETLLNKKEDFTLSKPPLLLKDSSLNPGEFRLQNNGGSILSTRRSLLKRIKTYFSSHPHLDPALQEALLEILRKFSKKSTVQQSTVQQ